MQRTKIEYLTHVWNPIAMRCTKISEGCANCWHLRMCKRLAANPAIDGFRREAYAGGKPFLDARELWKPAGKMPARIGVQFMGDLFHEQVPLDWIRQVFGVMELTSQHTFFILTKRPVRMLEFARVWGRHGGGLPENVWCGVSIEDQPTVEERGGVLLTVPATHLWISYEPALGPVDFDDFSEHGDPFSWLDQGIGWVVIGQETGPKARSAKSEWFNAIIEQARGSGMPMFVKKAPPGVEIVREYPEALR